MQTSVPDLMDLSKEPDSVFEMYGPESRKPGTYAANCLLARRLAERNVRFIQLYHRGWDQHKDLPRDLALQCKGTDQPTAALITDLKQRGLLDDTLVMWGGEFGRTVFSQGKLTDVNYGRDHHPRNFCMWVAGGGTKRGFVLGETDDFSYNVVSDPVSVYDLQATILHLLGIDHTKLTYRFQGRDFRLTDVHGEVATKIPRLMRQSKVVSGSVHETVTTRAARRAGRSCAGAPRRSRGSPGPGRMSPGRGRGRGTAGAARRQRRMRLRPGPMPMPMSVSRVPCHTTIATTLPGDAPMAIRTPISGIRCETL